MPSLANSIRKSAPLPSMRTRKDGKSPADPLTLPPVQSWEGSTTRRRQRRRAWAGVGIHSDREPSSRSPSCGPGPLRVPRGRRAGLSRPRRRSRRPLHRVARDTHPFARVVAPARSPSRGPGPLRVPRGRRAGLSRPRRRSRHPLHHVARDTHPFARVVAPSRSPSRGPGPCGASWPACRTTASASLLGSPAAVQPAHRPTRSE